MSVALHPQIKGNRYHLLWLSPISWRSDYCVQFEHSMSVQTQINDFFHTRSQPCNILESTTFDDEGFRICQP